MVLHIKDEETDRLVRQLAAIWGLGLTETIRKAVQQSLVVTAVRPSLWERTGDLRSKYAGGSDISTDKAFFDNLSERDPL